MKTKSKEQSSLDALMRLLAGQVDLAGAEAIMTGVDTKAPSWVEPMAPGELEVRRQYLLHIGHDKPGAIRRPVWIDVFDTDAYREFKKSRGL